MAEEKSAFSGKLELLMLVLILGLAGYVAFIPHQGYSYPVHLDEWMGLGATENMLEMGDLSYLTQGINRYYEVGFHLFWGVFHQISGIAWLDIFRFFPSVLFIFTTLTVYAFARRQGYGLEAALFVALIPTTVGILGPALLVPLSQALFLATLILLLVFNFSGIRAYLVLAILVVALTLTHPPSVICMIILLIPYVLLNLKDRLAHGVGIIIATLFPIVAAIPWMSKALLPSLARLLETTSVSEYVQIPNVLQLYGYPVLFFCLLGVFVLAMKRGKDNYGVILGLLVLVLMLVAFYVFHHGIPILYERGLVYMMLVMGIVAGAGLNGIRNTRLPAGLTDNIKPQFLAKHVFPLVSLIIAGVILLVAVPDRLDIPYYHMIDDTDYQAFVWIKNNVPKDDAKAVVDPWKGYAFEAISRKQAYSAIEGYPTESDKKAYLFFQGGGSDTAFLKDNGISIIYTRVYNYKSGRNIEIVLDNPDVVKLTDNVYLFQEGAGGG